MARQELEEFEVEVSLNFTEFVKARTVNEAVKKLEDKYIHGKGRLPRDYIDITVPDSDNYYWCQVED
jgi:hypothetical protein